MALLHSPNQDDFRHSIAGHVTFRCLWKFTALFHLRQGVLYGKATLILPATHVVANPPYAGAGRRRRGRGFKISRDSS